MNKNVDWISSFPCPLTLSSQILMGELGKVNKLGSCCRTEISRQIKEQNRCYLSFFLNWRSSFWKYPTLLFLKTYLMHCILCKVMQELELLSHYFQALKMQDTDLSNCSFRSLRVSETLCQTYLLSLFLIYLSCPYFFSPSKSCFWMLSWV